MLFMIIETFNDQDMVPVYERLESAGRALPEGLTYVDSWIESTFGRCFQLMECDDASVIQQWILEWRGTGTRFEVIPVVPSKRTREVIAPHLSVT